MANLRTAMLMMALAVLLPLLVHASVPFRVCEDSTQQVVASGDRSEVQMVYNSKRREYFAVHLFIEGQQTSVVGQRFDERGSPVGSLIMISPSNAPQQHAKQFPVVAYNNVTDNYLVVWEYDFNGDGKDWDIVARAVTGEGTPLGSSHFYVAASFGREDSPHIAYSYQDNNFVVVHEVQSGRDRGIAVQRLNETGYMGSALLFNTTFADREPFIAYHPPTNDYAIVWEFNMSKDNKSVIGAVVVGGQPLVARNSEPFIVGSTVETIGETRTIAHDHDASLVWSSNDNTFLLTWEVDGDSGDKEVVCSLMTAEGHGTRYFRVVGNSSHPYDRKPAAVYSPFTDEYFIIYETGVSSKDTGIEGVAFHARDLKKDGSPFAVSQALNKEHLPAAALSTTCGSILAVWASDTTQAQPPHSGGHRRRAALEDSHLPNSDPSTPSKPTVRFVQQDEEPIAKRNSNEEIMSVRSYAARSKFEAALGRRAAGHEAHEAVPLIYHDSIDLPSERAAVDTTERSAPPSTYSLQSLRVCLPDRGSCSTAGTPLPVPSHKPNKGGHGGGGGGGGDDDDGGSSATSVVVGLLVTGVVLAGLGAAGYLAWRRREELRERWESWRSGGSSSGGTSLGVWADESEFSISVDAFSNDDSGSVNSGDDH